MRIITANVNGIRSAAKKGFFDWLAEQNADVVCMQEVRCGEEDLAKTDIAKIHALGFSSHICTASKKGYSGVMVLSKHPIDKVSLDHPFDFLSDEGRFLEVNIKDLKVCSLYFPSGSHSEERQKLKFRYLEEFKNWLTKENMAAQKVVFCGDINIAHKEIDIKNWKGNLKNSGFLPEERAWLDWLFQNGFVDVFREVNQNADQYTWWSNRGRAREKNVGWRIDYQIVSEPLKKSIKEVSIFKEKFFSDHAPLIVDYNI